MSLAIPGRFWVILAESPVKRRDRRCVFYEMIDFPIRKRHFLVWWSVGGPWEPPGRRKRRNQMFLQSPLSGEKKCEHFSSSEKRTFGREPPARAPQPQLSAKCIFFREKKSACTFFRPIGATVGTFGFLFFSLRGYVEPRLATSNPECVVSL